jgi:serine/threonine-protein kinase
MNATSGNVNPAPSPAERHQRSGLGITAKIFLATVGVVVLAIGGAVGWTSMRANQLMERAVREEFASTQYVFDNIQESRFDRLQRLNALVAEDPTFKAVVLETDEATQHDDLLRRKASLGADLVIVTNPEGLLLARSDDSGRPGQDLSAWPLVAKALAGENAAGLLADGGHLHHAVALPIGIGGEELAGVLLSGYLIDDRLAAEMKRTTGTDVAFLSLEGGKPALAASTIESPEKVASVLAFGALTAASASSDPMRTSIGSESYLGFASPLAEPGGARAGSLLVFRSIAQELANFNELRRNILLIGVVATLVALLLSYLLASRLSGPLVSLVRVADSVTDGDYDVKVPEGGGDEVGALAGAIRAMVRELRDKAELERYVAELGNDATMLSQTPRPADTVARTSGGTPMEPAIGQVFAGRYEILEVIGVGGMGKVYRARDRQLDDVVALKTIRRDAIGAGPAVMERFKQELKLARKATHRNILRMHDFGEASGIQYLTMEYVHGITLREMIKRQPDVPLGIGLRIARQICHGLHVAHEAGIIHRDVKSANILIQPGGELKIMDFGIARLVEASGLTTAGMVIGTPEPMAPEQATGRDADARSDIYSAGCVFHEIFTGSLPFTAASVLELMRKHSDEQPKPLRAIKPSLPPEVEAIVMKMLQKDPARRFQSFAEIITALGAIPERAAA